MNEKDLHNYQLQCVDHGTQNKYSGLFLDMGLGKTVITLTIINKLLYEELEIKNVLIVAPKRVAETVWEEEAKKWDHLKHLKFSKIIGSQKERMEAINAKAEVYIISRDNIAWLCGLFGGLKLPYDMLVLDELSSFKSHRAQRFKVLKNVRTSLTRVIGLTGTPASNGFIDLWAQLYLIDRGERLEKTISRYRELYFRAGQTVGNVVYSYKLLTDSEAKITEKIKDICISMKSFDYLQMPMRTDNFIPVVLTSDVQKSYNKFEQENIISLFGGPDEGIQVITMYDENGEPYILETEEPKQITALTAAALSNKLLQYANGAIYDENHDYHVVHDQKLDVLEEIIEDANGQSVLVAWNYKHDRDRIMKRLEKYKPRELKTSKDINDWNDGKIQVLLAHPASAGHGLNLQRGGSLIVWFSVNWSLELYQQFNSRVYRQGQDKHVIIHHLIAEHTHDEDVMKAIQAKDRKQETLLSAIKAKVSKYVNGFS